MKKYRDEKGKLTMTLEELKQATRDEAADYYRPGKLYTHGGEYYVYLTPIAPDDNAVFEAFDGRQIVIPADSLGTFLPGVASAGMEIALV